MGTGQVISKAGSWGGRRSVLTKFLEIINRPGVAGAVLQSPPSLIHSFIHL